VGAITVSRAIREPLTVAPATLQRIEAAIAEVGYIPNQSAADLARGAGRTVAAVVPTLEAPYFAAGLAALIERAEAEQASLSIGQTLYDPARGDRLVTALLASRPRGVVLFGADVTGPAGRAALARADIPVVEAWELVARPIGISIGFSHQAACQRLAEHLIARGRRRIAFVVRAPIVGRAAQRIAGWRAALDAAGLTGEVVAVPEAQPYAVGWLAATQLDTSDAVMCAADTVAVGVLGGLARRGRRVPEDIAVAGFGDLDVAAVVTPALTTIAVPTARIGAAAGDHLFDPRWRDAAAAAPARDFGFELVVRDSA
jgi:LacI family gluconate utilization system Gnt-I transcriptional repressor